MHRLDALVARQDADILEFPLYVPIGEPGTKVVLGTTTSTKADDNDLPYFHY